MACARHNTDNSTARGYLLRTVSYTNGEGRRTDLTGGLGIEANTFYKRLADLITSKQDKPYSTVMCWLRCRLSFAILLCAITSFHRPRCDQMNNIFFHYIFYISSLFNSALLLLFACIYYHSDIRTDLLP